MIRHVERMHESIDDHLHLTCAPTLTLGFIQNLPPQRTCLAPHHEIHLGLIDARIREIDEDVVEEITIFEESLTLLLVGPEVIPITQKYE